MSLKNQISAPRRFRKTAGQHLHISKEFARTVAEWNYERLCFEANQVQLGKSTFTSSEREFIKQCTVDMLLTGDFVQHENQSFSLSEKLKASLSNFSPGGVN